MNEPSPDRGVVDAIDIVPAGLEMAAALATLHRGAFPQGWDDHAMARLLRGDAARAFAALEGYAHTPLGFVLAFAAAGEAEILALAVVADRRRSGIGKRLVKALIEALAQDGDERLYLEVGVNNGPAQALYHGLGFHEVGRRKAYYTHPGAPAEDALIMSRPLPQPVT